MTDEGHLLSVWTIYRRPKDYPGALLSPVFEGEDPCIVETWL